MSRETDTVERVGYIRAPMDASQIGGAAAERNGEPLVRSLGAWGLALLVINGVIGAGIFGLPGKAAAEAGTASPLVFLACGALLVPVVLAFAQVSSLFRGSGGPMLYAKEAFGPATGFLTGWAFYVTRVSASAANLAVMVASLEFVSAGVASGVTRQILLLTLCSGMVFVNVIGTRRAIQAVGALTLLKALPLLALIVVGLWQNPGSLAADPVLPAGGDFGAAVVLVVYAYVGWETGLVPAGEARNPSRDMPRALVLGLLAITVLYVLIQSVAVAALPDLAQSGSPLVDVGEALLGTTGGLLLMIGVVVSVGGNVLSATFSMPRLTFAMGRDGLLPAWFGKVDERFGTPARSIVVYGALVFLLASLGTFRWLAEVSVLSRLLLYLVGVLALPRLRKRLDLPVRSPVAAALPIVAAAICVLGMTQVSAQAAAMTAGFLVVGALLYGAGPARTRLR
jgi:amino acid transporter